MTIAQNRPMTLEEYLNYDGELASYRCELWNGVIVEMGAESDINVLIGTFLIVAIAQIIPYQLIRRGTEVEVEGELANTRVPDLLILTEEGVAALSRQKRSLVRLDMPAPALAIEIVSSSKTDRQSYERDYVDKRQEYAQRGIPEYWIVDAMAKPLHGRIANKVTVLTLDNRAYLEQTFTGKTLITSAALPSLSLSATQILTAQM
ncbi:MAG: Uma2 family endonuclease [Cyanobacteria bacterium J06649_4]